ncbi:MAG: acylphosphatase [Planctomycetota bacterium]
MSQTAKRIIFVGRVQGVGFRFTVYNVANRYALTGWVRNLLDGTVEMLAQGTSDDIDYFLRDIRDAFGGYIRETKIEQIPLDTQYKDFKITF